MRRPEFFAGFCAALGFAGAASTASAQTAPAPNSPPVMAGDQTYRIFADVVTAGAGPVGVQGVGCVNQTVFFPGDTIVFRAVIADGPTGTPLTAADIAQRGVTANVALSDGTQIPLTLKSHPPVPSGPHNTYWSGSRHIPADHPTGTLKWTLTVTDKAGHSTAFVPMGQDNNATILTLAQKAVPATPR